MKVLVTGGAGFLGSNLTKYLLDQGHEVVVIDDLSYGDVSLVDPRSEFHKESIANQKYLEKILPNINVVFHLAALSTIGLSLERPDLYFEHNVMYGIKLLEAMKVTGVKKIIFSSTGGAAYGGADKLSFREEDPTEPINAYGSSKIAFEPVLSAYWNSFGIEAIILRYFNIYGPNDDQADTPRAIPIWIKAAIAGKPFPVYWQGKQKRDYVYVGDVCRANLIAAEKGRGYRVYNVGGGIGLWMYDIAEKINCAFGGNCKIKDMGERFGDVPIAVANITRIKEELGWKPEVFFDEGLRITLDHYK
tara:strand:- start:1994 stop:2905 length:912 start_codon:yes stop_codon:yes gene_type:complete